jgi:hypothetical protein
MVRRYIADVTPEALAAPRTNPHAPDHPETVLSCLRTRLEEEWEHHRYAVLDLDALTQARTPPAQVVVADDFEGRIGPARSGSTDVG